MTDAPQMDSGEWEAPSSELVGKALLLLGRPERHRAFYLGLENPRWIAPLAEAGAFRTAQGPVPAGDGYVRFPFWDEGEYLAGMAAHAPDEVVAVLLQADTNGNPSVWRLIVDAAIALPVEQAELLTDLIGGSVTSEWHEWLDPLKLVALLEHLSSAPSTRALSKLANAMCGCARRSPKSAAPRAFGRWGWGSPSTGITRRCSGRSPRCSPAWA